MRRLAESLGELLDIYHGYANHGSDGREALLRTVSVFRNNRNQAIRLPKDLAFPGVTELTIEKRGDTIMLRPVRPSWISFPTAPSPTRISCVTARK